MLAGRWRDQLDLEDLTSLKKCLASAGAAADDFEPEAEQPFLDETLEAWQRRGAWTSPCIELDDQIFIGRAQLPMIRWLAGGRQRAGSHLTFGARPR